MTAMKTDELQKLRQELETHRDELKQLADEVRVKVHLAGLEAKDTWKELLPRVEDYARRVENITHDAATDLRRAGADLKTRLRRLRDGLL